jgi:peptide-methionine (S)-S-oxide reductase
VAGVLGIEQVSYQDYLQRYPTGYTCHYVTPGWRLPRCAAAS